jgi:GxxExxY protein
MLRELQLQSIPAVSQHVVPIEYKGLVFDEPLRMDVYVDRCLILELKAVEKILPIHKAQLLSYMKLVNAPIGLLINFHEMRLVDGVHRLVLRGADQGDYQKIAKFAKQVVSVSLTLRVLRELLFKIL